MPLLKKKKERKENHVRPARSPRCGGGRHCHRSRRLPRPPRSPPLMARDAAWPLRRHDTGQRHHLHRRPRPAFRRLHCSPPRPRAPRRRLPLRQGCIRHCDQIFPCPHFAQNLKLCVQELKGRHTYELNLSGNVVLPGFIDSHVHFIDGGLQLPRVSLRGVRSKDDLISKVKEAVKGTHHGQWVLGGGWNNDVWGGEFPTSSWFDDISPDNPLWLSGMDGHMGVGNSLAMKIAGIDKNTNDPVGGTIMRTAEGGPTGLLVNAAMKLVFDVIPKVSIHERREALLRASRHALSRGITTVVDVGSYFPGSSDNKSW